LNSAGCSDLQVIDLQREVSRKLTFTNEESGGVWLTNNDIVFNVEERQPESLSQEIRRFRRGDDGVQRRPAEDAVQRVT